MPMDSYFQSRSMSTVFKGDVITFSICGIVPALVFGSEPERRYPSFDCTEVGPLPLTT
ncbi:hypothetical protein DPMN_176638 [Dreissena polymorpha]|uniref:Uncharacterized protein n=1 Tax=Dreissena polymorpha TaxID=45954 RepID=A0A9D4E8R1_DREPO|nr:hypothetical protein DPMN_176638 [Dreissena polymorpha]